MREKALKLSIILLILIILGTTGFYYIEKTSLLDSFYITIATMTTLGNTSAPISSAGKILSAMIVVLGIGTLLVWAQSLIGSTITQRFEVMLGMVHKKKKLKKHTILCGFGHVGKNVAKELKNNKVEFIVIDNDENIIKGARDMGYNTVYGDALNEDILAKADIASASNLISSFKEDAGNVFVCLSAKSLNSNVRVIVKANSEEAIRKMYKAGADLVMSPDVMISKFLANSVISPSTADMIWNVPISKDIDIMRFAVKKDSKVANKLIREIPIRDKSGASILAVSRGNDVLVNPKDDSRILINDHLILVGTKEQLGKANRFL